MPQRRSSWVKCTLTEACDRLQANDATLRHLILDYRGISDDGAEKLATSLETNTFLISLSLWGNHIGDGGSARIAKALESNVTLRSLDLKYNNIGHHGAIALAASLRKNQSLRVLGLTKNNIGLQGIKEIFSALKTREAPLERIYLRSCGLGTDAARVVAESLPDISGLKEISLWSNHISDSGARALAEALYYSRDIISLALDNNHASRETLENIVSLTEHRLKGATAPLDEPHPSPFYLTLMHESSEGGGIDHSIAHRLMDLASLLEDPHQMQIFYTVVCTFHRMGCITSGERDECIRSGITRTSHTTTSTEAVSKFKLILDKAEEDRIIDRGLKYTLDQVAETKSIENADFIRDMREAIKQHTTRIEGLEATADSMRGSLSCLVSNVRELHESMGQLESNIEAVNQSTDQLRKGLRFKLRVETAVAFIGTVLNAVSFGVAGSAFKGAVDATLGSIVDFGDIAHIRSVAKSVNNTKVEEALEFGLQIAEQSADEKLRKALNTDEKIQKALNEDNPLVVIAACASYTATVTVPERAIAQNPLVPKGITFHEYDSGLDTDEEKEYPLHAAIKFDDAELLAEDMEHEYVNKIDSKGRSPADYAAIKGKIEMMRMLEEKGGEFFIGSKARMRAVARKKSRVG